MTFGKTADKNLTQMAQWVDLNMNEPSCDEDKLCEYVYRLIYTYAHKHIAFKDYEQLDDFCVYCCSRLFIRLRRNTKESLTPIKSIVNYIRHVCNLWYADYLRENSYGCPDVEYADFDLFDFGDYLIDASSESDFHSYTMCYVDPSKVVCKYLSKKPKKKHSSEWMNIYISCLYTINDRIRCLQAVSRDLNPVTDAIEYNRRMRAVKNKKPILFHVDETMSNYIDTLVTVIIHAISSELSYSVAAKVSVSTCLHNLVAAANNDEDE